MPGQEPTLIASVQRALNLLDAVGECDRPVPAKTLARRTGMPLATTYHLLRTLVHAGYLTRVEGAGYVLGDRVTALSEGRGGAAARVARFRPILEQLHDQLHAAAYVSMLDDGEIRLVDVVDGPTTPRVDLWVGFEDAGHATALGKAVLSALEDGNRREYLGRHDLIDLTPHTVTDRNSLLRELRAGADFAVDKQEYALGTACVAAAAPSRSMAAAVAVSVPAHRLDRVLERADVLRRAAHLVALAGP